MALGHLLSAAETLTWTSSAAATERAARAGRASVATRTSASNRFMPNFPLQPAPAPAAPVAEIIASDHLADKAARLRRARRKVVDTHLYGVYMVPASRP